MLVANDMRKTDRKACLFFVKNILHTSGIATNILSLIVSVMTVCVFKHIMTDINACYTLEMI